MRFPLCMSFTIPRDGDGAGQGVGAPAAGPGENGPDGQEGDTGQEGQEGEEGPEGPQDQQTAYGRGFDTQEPTDLGRAMDNPQFEGPMPSLEDAPDPNRHDPQPPDTQGPRDHNGVTSEPLGPPEGYSPGVPI